MKKDFATLSLVELSRMIRNRKVSCSELVQGYLERIKQYDGRDGLNVYITVNGEKAIAEAKRLDDLMKQNKTLGPLHGIPLAIKDNLDTKVTPDVNSGHEAFSHAAACLA